MNRFAWMGIAMAAVSAGILFAQPPVSPYEKVVSDIFNSLQRMTKALAMIQDGDSAKKAKPSITEEVARFLKIRADAEKMPQPKKDEKDDVSFRYRIKLADVMTKFKAEYRRAKGIPGSAIALQEMKLLFQTPKKQGKTKTPDKK